MKNIFSVLFILIILFALFSIPAYAVGEYTVLAPLPGIGDTTNGVTTLKDYLPAAFKLGIAIAAALAFVVITFGGITYAVSDSITGKQQGQEWINNALWGLLLALGAYAILYTINPQTLHFNLSIKTPEIAVGTASVTPGVPMSPEEIAESERIRAILEAGGIYPYADPCGNGQTTGCVNLNGLPPYAINGLLELNRACGRCGFNITGGTEGGHFTHGINQPIVDIRRPWTGLDRYVQENKVGEPTQVQVGGQARSLYVVRLGSGTVTFLDEGNHWHVNINNY